MDQFNQPRATRLNQTIVNYFNQLSAIWLATNQFNQSTKIFFSMAQLSVRHRILIGVVIKHGPQLVRSGEVGRGCTHVIAHTESYRHHRWVLSDVLHVRLHVDYVTLQYNAVHYHCITFCCIHGVHCALHIT